MEETYKGYKITYEIYNNDFKAEIGESVYRNKDLEKVRKHIDDLDKKDFERFTVIKRDGWINSEWVKCTVTSMFCEDGSVYAWVVNNKKRSKEDIKSLYADTQENWGKIEIIIQRIKKIEEIEEQNKILISSLEKAKVPESGAKQC